MTEFAVGDPSSSSRGSRCGSPEFVARDLETFTGSGGGPALSSHHFGDIDRVVARRARP